jgi:hypothetical protein
MINPDSKKKIARFAKSFLKYLMDAVVLSVFSALGDMASQPKPAAQKRSSRKKKKRGGREIDV